MVEGTGIHIYMRMYVHIDMIQVLYTYIYIHKGMCTCMYMYIYIYIILYYTILYYIILYYIILYCIILYYILYIYIIICIHTYKFMHSNQLHEPCGCQDDHRPSAEAVGSSTHDRVAEEVPFGAVWVSTLTLAPSLFWYRLAHSLNAGTPS